MRACTPLITRLARLWCLALMLVFLVPGGLEMATVAHAQQSGERSSGGGLLRFLFQRNEPPRQDRVAPPPSKQRKTAPARRAEPRVVVPATPVVEKAENAKRVLVVGDFMASGLAEGLSTAFAENPNVQIVDRANGSSGLVRNDHYDWPANLASVIETEKAAVVVVMLGSNDRQQMSVAGTREAVRSEAWTAEYERRATALAKAARSKGVPLIWVGNLPFRPATMSSDMIALNDIYRRIVTDVEGDYVDVWGGFVDETGSFVASGPDMNGQPAQLRASDGINVTRQGRRKIAFYVEKPLARFVDGIAPTGPQPAGPADAGSALPQTIEPEVIDRTAPIAIDEMATGTGSGLLGAIVRPARAEKEASSERASPVNRPGRADEFMRVQKRTPAPRSETTTSSIP
jgi:hypothetical protein